MVNRNFAPQTTHLELLASATRMQQRPLFFSLQLYQLICYARSTDLRDRWIARLRSAIEGSSTPSKKCLSIIPGILFWYNSGFVRFKIMNISDTCSITDDSLH